MINEYKMIFERMPGIRAHVAITFVRIDHATVTCCLQYRGLTLGGVAKCHPNDTYSLETGMKVSLKYASDFIFSSDRELWNQFKAIYKGFRRWIWLQKLANQCRLGHDPYSCRECNIKVKKHCLRVTGKKTFVTIRKVIANEFGTMRFA